jgi:hypothetical protein
MNRNRWRRPVTEPDVAELAGRLRAALPVFDPPPDWVRDEAEALAALSPGGAAPFGAAADLVLTELVARCWELGWQPVDLWQLFRRRYDEPSVEFLVGVIAAQMARYAAAAVHPRWRAQLARLGAEVWWDGADPYCVAWACRSGADHTGLLVEVLRAVCLLRGLPREPVLVPPPGSSAATGAGADPAAAEVDAKVLARVRALLAKAESTPFPEEADAFFAKAQELMSRYSLERAVVDASGAGGGPAVHTGGRRIWLDNPYLSAKSMLVDAVGRANRCRVVFSRGLGYVNVLGVETDCEIVEVLATSLLVQASRAMVAAGRRSDARGTSRTRSFRQAFLVSYAHRISERLTEASARAEAEVGAGTAAARGGSLLPVLAAREAAVTEYVERIYPKLVTRTVSVSNSAGWTAGRVAADLAVLDAHRAVTG